MALTKSWGRSIKFRDVQFWNWIAVLVIYVAITCLAIHDGGFRPYIWVWVVGFSQILRIGGPRYAIHAPSTIIVDEEDRRITITKWFGPWRRVENISRRDLEGVVLETRGMPLTEFAYVLMVRRSGGGVITLDRSSHAQRARLDAFYVADLLGMPLEETEGEEPRTLLTCWLRALKSRLIANRAK